MSLSAFITSTRTELVFTGNTLKRKVFKSEVARQRDVGALEGYMANRVPLYYRDPEKIAADLKGRGFFLEAVADTLARLPTAEDFRNSHFGELLAAEFATAALDLRLLYSKLRLLSSQNSNAYKMDVLMYDLKPEPVELVLLEVKSSFKTASADKAPRHHKSIYPDLFASLKEYAKDDLRYDLTAARDRLSEVAAADRDRVEAALSQYGGPRIRYAGICSIDLETHFDNEAKTLATRSSPHPLDVDLVCVTEFAQVIDATFDRLEKLREAATW